MYVKNFHTTLTEGYSAVAGRSVNVVARFGSILCDVIWPARSSRQSGEHLGVHWGTGL